MEPRLSEERIKELKDKALWVRKETLEIHRISQGTRVASSLSPVEIFVTLYYSGILNFDPTNVTWEGRDRLIVSKAHGSISLYPILADLGYFDRKELGSVGMEGSFLGGIPDPIIPGYETVNGSLGHGLGLACGMALGLKRLGRQEKVFVVLGDGELYEGSVWEAAMFACEHKLDNLVAIIDNNKICMLGYCNTILNLDPLGERFRVFGWNVEEADGHDISKVHDTLSRFKEAGGGSPKLLVANTIKGKGVPALEGKPLSHVMNIRPEDIDAAIEGLR